VTKERRLGRGLAALLGGSFGGGPDGEAAAPIAAAVHDDEGQTVAIPHPAVGSADARPQEGPGLVQLSVYEIDDNPFQPRREFSEPEIASLAESLKEHDMIQPVVVRRVADRWQLISGERRLRAAIHAGWSHVPARVRQADDRLVAELAIVENLQRKDLNPIEKALSFKRYIDEHGCTQEDLARRIKIDRSTVANLMRLLELPATVQDALRGGSISAGHARALLPLGDESAQIEHCERIRREGLSVRDIERVVQEKIEAEDADPLEASAVSAAATRRRTRNEHLAALEQELRVALGTKIDIRQTGSGRGRIVIHFAGHDEFDRIREHLSGNGPSRQAKAA
jgi:ParB family chromosome partitioning protein